jgi:glycogen operon protein
VAGSSDLYGSSPKGPLQSINFVTCHDGFTLNDLVSYREKRNNENGEDNLDGETHNLECAFGPDGPDESPDVTRIRKRLIKNFIATLFLSQGIPMLLGGDEFRRTQRGNNNAYCQDNEISWVNWRLREQNEDLVRFTREMIRFRKSHPILRRGEFFTGSPHGGIDEPDLTWYGPDRGTSLWGADCHSIAMLINGRYAGLSNGGNDDDIFCIFNASWKTVTFTLPEAPSGGSWRRAVDTSRESPDDISGAEEEPVPCDGSFTAAPRSVAVLLAPLCS